MNPMGDASSIRFFAAALVVLFLVGCAGSNDLSDFQPPPPGPFTAAGQVTTLDAEGNPVPLSGATVCLSPGGAGCVESGADGFFELASFPPLTETAVTISRSGYLSQVIPLPALPSDPANTTDLILSDPSYTGLASDADAESFVLSSGGSYPLGDSGIVQLTVFTLFGDPFDPDAAAFAQNPAGGTGPILLAAGEGFGTWGFFNVPPGVIDFEIGLAPFSCVIAGGFSTPWVGGFATGWVGNLDEAGKAASLKVPVQAGAMTVVQVGCDFE